MEIFDCISQRGKGGGRGGGVTVTPQYRSSHTPITERAGFFRLQVDKKVGFLLAKRDVLLQTRHVEGVPFIKNRITKGVHNWYTIG